MGESRAETDLSDNLRLLEGLEEQKQTLFTGPTVVSIHLGEHQFEERF